MNFLLIIIIFFTDFIKKINKYKKEYKKSFIKYKYDLVLTYLYIFF